MLIANWLFLTIVLVAGGYLFFKVFYYKNLYDNAKKNNDVLKGTIKEADVLIKKYQIQMQRSLGNIDILNEEMGKLRGDVKTFKARNSQYRIENERIRNKVKELETKIEALL
jgi:predicted nuclease with TOPRIM domain